MSEGRKVSDEEWTKLWPHYPVQVHPCADTKDGWVAFAVMTYVGTGETAAESLANLEDALRAEYELSVSRSSKISIRGGRGDTEKPIDQGATAHDGGEAERLTVKQEQSPEDLIADTHLAPAMDRLDAILARPGKREGRGRITTKMRIWLYAMCKLAIHHNIEWRNPALEANALGDILAVWENGDRRLILTIGAEECLITRHWLIEEKTEIAQAQVVMPVQAFDVYRWLMKG